MRLYIIILFICCGMAASARQPPIYWTAALNHDNTCAAVGGDDGSIIVFETKNWTILKSFRHDSVTITKLSWHPQQNLLAIAGYAWSQKQSFQIRIWNMATGNTVLLDASGSRGIGWSPGGQLLGVTCGAGDIAIFNSAGVLLRRFNSGDTKTLVSLSWHPHKAELLTTGDDIRMFDTSGRLLHVVQNSRQPKLVLTAQWHPSGSFFATGDYGYEGGEASLLKFWSPQGQLIKTIRQSGAEIRSIAWSPDGNTLAMASDGLRLFKKNGQLLWHKSPNPGALLWGIAWSSHSGQLLVSDNKGGIILVSRNGRLVKKIAAANKH